MILYRLKIRRRIQKIKEKYNTSQVSIHLCMYECRQVKFEKKRKNITLAKQKIKKQKKKRK